MAVRTTKQSIFIIYMKENMASWISSTWGRGNAENPLKVVEAYQAVFAPTGAASVTTPAFTTGAVADSIDVYNNANLTPVRVTLVANGITGQKEFIVQPWQSKSISLDGLDPITAVTVTPTVNEDVPGITLVNAANFALATAPGELFVVDITVVEK